MSRGWKIFFSICMPLWLGKCEPGFHLRVWPTSSLAVTFCDYHHHSKPKCSIMALSIPAMISFGNSPMNLTSLDRSNVLI